jgi:inward rectifier potassium channel
MAKHTIDPGIGEKYVTGTQRIMNPDGSFNLKREKVKWKYKNVYQDLIEASWTRFFIIVIIAFFIANLIFAFIYAFIGINNLEGSQHYNVYQAFLNEFFFSVQTFTTVGYGVLAPRGVFMNAVASLEALTGLMTFAVITGLLYGRFSKPKALLVYSEKAIIAPFKEGKALMIRVANGRTNTLIEIEANMLLTVVEKTAHANKIRRYYQMHLERATVYFLPLTWTIVHPIDENSPFHGKSLEELLAGEPEILVMIKAYDETFSQVVHSRVSYVIHDVVWNARFLPAFGTDAEGKTIFEVDKVGLYEKLEKKLVAKS